jgi:hypothetical protein
MAETQSKAVRPWVFGAQFLDERDVGPFIVNDHVGLRCPGFRAAPLLTCDGNLARAHGHRATIEHLQ